MSASQEKATRRDLRRVLGIEAEQALLRQSEAVGFVSQSVLLHEAAIKSHSLDINELKLQATGHDGEISSMERQLVTVERRLDLHQEMFNRGFRRRLRWLLTGE